MSMGRIAIAVLPLFFLVSFQQKPSSRFANSTFDSLLNAADALLYHDFSKSDSLYSQAERMLVEAGIDKYEFSWIDLNTRRALASIYNSRYSLGRKYLEVSREALKNARGIGGEYADSLSHSVAFAEALYFWNTGNYEEALSNLTAVADYTKSRPRTSASCQQLFRTLQFQASLYRMKGEYESAVNEYLASNAYYDCYRDPGQCANYVLTYRNVGNTLTEKGDYQRALEFFWRGKSNLAQCERQGSSRTLKTHGVVLYHSIGDLYIRMNVLDSAEFYLRKAMPVMNENPAFVPRILSGLGKIALQRGDLGAAREFFNRELSIQVQRYGEKHGNVASAYSNLASLSEAAGDLWQALGYVQKGLNSLAGIEQVDSAISSNPSLNSISSKKSMMQLLFRKGRLLTQLHNVTSQDSLLYFAQTVTGMAIELIHSSRHDFALDKDKVVLVDESMRVYEQAIQIELELFKQTGDLKHLYEAFTLIDNGKSAVLFDHLKLVKEFSRIPPHVILQASELRAELSFAEEALFQAESRNQDASAERMALADFKQAHAALQAQIEESYPEYYRLLLDDGRISLNEVQADILIEGQAMIEYFVGDTAFYSAFISRDTFALFSAPIGALHEEIFAFRDLIIRPDADADERLGRTRVLYDMLVSPWRHLATDLNALIIVPHSALTYIPFEALSDGTRNLVDDFSISYAYSARLLREQNQMGSRGSSFAGFSANYAGHPFLPSLNGAVSEIQAIQRVIGSDAEIFINATAAAFKEQASNRSVIHLALHSFLHDEKPLFSQLVFSGADSTLENVITANELYAMELNAELVVLSACESGIGQLNRGEGMMSLSRAFMYAGVPSTVISLWKVPDQATSLLMTSFYRHLLDGHSKDKALTLAKREFIERYPQMASPYYWAGFIVNGKTESVSFSRPWTQRIVLAIAIFVLLLLPAAVVMRRRRRRIPSRSVVSS